MQKDDFVRNPTGLFDPLVFLDACWNSIQQMRWNELKKAEVWAMVLLALYFGMRTSSLAEYCPDVEDLRMPPKSRPQLWCADGLPTLMIVGFRNWKSRPPGQTGDNHIVHLMIVRNTLDPRFCVMAALLLWLGLSKIQRGPIFPAIRAGKIVVAEAK